MEERRQSDVEYKRFDIQKKTDEEIGKLIY